MMSATRRFILTDEVVAQAMIALEGVWKDRIYTPLVTLWVFLSQVLSADHSCRGAVARFLAHRLSQGQSPCSAETGAYCEFIVPPRKATITHDLLPRSISFKGARQTLEAFQPLIERQAACDSANRLGGYVDVPEELFGRELSPLEKRFADAIREYEAMTFDQGWDWSERVRRRFPRLVEVVEAIR